MSNAVSCYTHPFTCPSHLQYIIVEGNIGVGKTTLIKKWVNDDPTHCTIIAEDISPQILKLFYDNPDRDAFALQLHVAAERRATLRFALQQTLLATAPSNDNSELRYCFFDRSIIGDLIFAKVQHDYRHMNDDQIAAYYAYVGSRLDETLVCNPTLREWLRNATPSRKPRIVFLADSPRAAMDRARQRSNAETTVSIDYFEHIDRLHFVALAILLASPEFAPFCHVIPWELYQHAPSDLLPRILTPVTTMVNDDDDTATTMAANCLVFDNKTRCLYPSPDDVWRNIHDNSDAEKLLRQWVDMAVIPTNTADFQTSLRSVLLLTSSSSKRYVGLRFFIPPHCFASSNDSLLRQCILLCWVTRVPVWIDDGRK